MIKLRDMSVNQVPLKKVLISGGTGFVGAATVRALAEAHPECAITIIDLQAPGSTHVVPGGVTFLQVDVTNLNEVRRAFEQVKPELVIHTAGIVPPLSERFGRRLERHAWRVNVQGTRNMLDAAKEANAEGFIYTSSCCVVVDCLGFPYHNIDERWPIPASSLIYGESKVGISL